jgi:hypothetical protein
VRERGAVSVLAVAVIGVVMTAGMVTMAVYSVVAAAAGAPVAADAAALAAAPVTFAPFGTSRSPEDEAAAYAEMNGAVLLECRCPPDPVWRERTVTVVLAVDLGWIPLEVDRVVAVASARFDPNVWIVDG